MGAPDIAPSGAQPTLAAAEPAKRTTRKRKQVSYMELDNDDEGVQCMGEIKKPLKATSMTQLEEITVEEPEPKKKKTAKKPKAEPGEEKRLKKYKAKPPQTYHVIKDRAVSQRMFVLDRKRRGTPEVPEETVQIAGSTGNIYTVEIKQVLSCDCPHAQKGKHCKHIIYVMLLVLKASDLHACQTALLSSELRDIFAKAPALPSADSKSESSDGNRKPIEDDCPICCMEFSPTMEEIVYCRAACGNNIHKACFDQWAVAKRSSGDKITCPFCRTEWQGELPNLKNVNVEGEEKNAEGYVNIAGQLGISGERDYSTYHSFWVNRQIMEGHVGREHWRRHGDERYNRRGYDPDWYD